MVDRYSNEAARAQGPDCDDSIPEHALIRIAELEKLARDIVTMLDAAGWPPHREPLAKRAAALLDLDPPGFDPATEGP